MRAYRIKVAIEYAQIVTEVEAVQLPHLPCVYEVHPGAVIIYDAAGNAIDVHEGKEARAWIDSHEEIAQAVEETKPEPVAVEPAPVKAAHAAKKKPAPKAGKKGKK